MTEPAPTAARQAPFARLRQRLPDARIALVWAALVAVYVLLRANLVAIPLERDEGLFGYIGQVILDGGLPYRDVVDHKPPLVYYLYALAILVLPPTATSIHIFLHVYTFATLLACYHLAKALTGSRSAGLWTALAFAVISSLPSLQGFSATTEMFLLLPATLGLWCAVIAARKRQARWIAMSGALGSCAFLTKQTGALLALWSTIYLMVSVCCGDASLRRKLRAVVATGLVWGLGFLVPVALVVAYFGFRGGLGDLTHWVVTYNLDYAVQVRTESAMHLARTKHLFEVAAFEALPVGVLATGTASLLLLRRDPLGRFVAGFLGFSFLAAFPASYEHYLVQLTPAVALAAGVGLARLGAWFPEGRWRSSMLLGFCALVVLFPVTACPKYYVTGTPEEISHDFFGANPFPEAREIADYIATRTDESDHVFILGSEAEILFYADRDGATRFPLKYPLTMPWSKRRAEFQQDVMAALEAAPPRYIVVVNYPGSLGWDGKTRFPLWEYTHEFMSSRYALEAIQPVTRHRAKMIHGAAATMAVASAEVAKGAVVLIYGRL